MNEVTFMTALIVGILAQAIGVLVGAAVVVYRLKVGSVWLHIAVALCLCCVVLLIAPAHRFVSTVAPWQQMKSGDSK